MHRLSIAAIAGMLALTTSGSDSSLTITQFSSTAVSPKKPGLATSKKSIILKPSQKHGYPEGLIPVTSGDERLKQLQFGRSDPFTVALPAPQLEVTPKPKKVFTELPKLPLIKELPLAPLKTPSKVAPPNTDLAKGVAVEGVVQIGDKSHAIVKLPTDATSRYVSVGQQLFGGRLLVKRIEIPTDSEPTVVLEQNGIEVSLALGGETAGDTGAIASSTLGQISSNEVISDEVRSETLASNFEALETVQVAQPQEYTVAKRVPTSPSSSLPQKKQLDKVAVAPAANVAPSTKGAKSEARARESYPTSQQKDSADELMLGSESGAESQHWQALQEQKESNTHVSSHPEDVTASAALENDVRQRLIERLRSGSNSLVENTFSTESPQALQAFVESPRDGQQLLRERHGDKKRRRTTGELSTSGSNIEVLAHRQRLINQLRGGRSRVNN